MLGTRISLIVNLRNLWFIGIMNTYITLKTIHLAAVFVFLTAGAVLFFSENVRVGLKISAHVSLFVILITGLGLVLNANLGVPPWIWGKLLIWLLLGLTGVFAAPKFYRYRVSFYAAMLFLATAAAFLAVAQPG